MRTQKKKNASGGNIEYLLHLRNCTDGSTFANDTIGASEIVEKAHETLDK